MNNLETNKSIVRRHLLVGVTEKRLDVYGEIMAEDYRLDVGRMENVLAGGREGYKRGLGHFQEAFPDMRIELLNIVAEGDLVAARYIERGTHTGERYMSSQASGRAYEKHGFGLYRIIEGKMVSGWVQEDEVGFAADLGLTTTSLGG